MLDSGNFGAWKDTRAAATAERRQPTLYNPICGRIIRGLNNYLRPEQADELQNLHGHTQANVFLMSSNFVILPLDVAEKTIN